MIRFVSFAILLGFSISLAVSADETPIQYTFSAATAEENKVTLQGAGFGAYPEAGVSFGLIPTDNAFDNATDGQGAIVTAQPGEGVMIFGERIITNQAAVIRCSVRTEQAHAAVTIATIGDKPDQFVATNSPSDEAYFSGQYQRLSTFCTPPSTGFQPVVQLVNTSQTEALTAYIDNFEVYTLDPNKYYSAAFLDNDTVDPPVEQISVPSGSEMGFSAGNLKTVTLSAVNFVFRFCPKGTLYRGSEKEEVNYDFWIGESEVTQGQWKAVMGSIPSQIVSEQQGSTMPVFYVSYTECTDFIAKLNKQNKGIFRFPTFLEWEYACRAGTSTTYHWGDDAEKIGSYEWYKGNSGGRPHTVKSRNSNAWSIYDMGGNIQEWTSNTLWGYFGICGGWYDGEATTCQSEVIPAYVDSSSHWSDLGFRLVLQAG